MMPTLSPGLHAATAHHGRVRGHARIGGRGAVDEIHLVGNAHQRLRAHHDLRAESAVEGGPGAAGRRGRAYRHAVAHPKIVHALANLADHAGILVAERDRHLRQHRHPARIGENAHIGVADAGRLHVDDDLPRSGGRLGQLASCNGSLVPVNLHDFIMTP